MLAASSHLAHSFTRTLRKISKTLPLLLPSLAALASDLIQPCRHTPQNGLAEVGLINGPTRIYSKQLSTSLWCLRQHNSEVRSLSSNPGETRVTILSATTHKSPSRKRALSLSRLRFTLAVPHSRHRVWHHQAPDSHVTFG
jgi:hypothetical protein